MEQEIKIKTLDNHVIYGNLTTAQNRAETLIVFVHGFTSSMNEHIIFNCAKLFTSYGYDTFRFNFYDWREGARHFQDTTLKQQGKDVSVVVMHFRMKYKKIIVIGHSFGGTSLLFADSNCVDAYVFWDASYIFPHQFNKPDFNYTEKLNAASIWKGTTYNLGAQFTDELKHFPDSSTLIAAIKKPVLFITSENNKKAGEEYYRQALEPKKYVHIDGADHTFDTIEDEASLLQHTYEWVLQLI